MLLSGYVGVSFTAQHVTMTLHYDIHWVYSHIYPPNLSLFWILSLLFSLEHNVVQGKHVI